MSDTITEAFQAAEKDLNDFINLTRQVLAEGHTPDQVFVGALAGAVSDLTEHPDDDGDGTSLLAAMLSCAFVRIAVENPEPKTATGPHAEAATMLDGFAATARKQLARGDTTTTAWHDSYQAAYANMRGNAYLLRVGLAMLTAAYIRLA